MAIFLIIMLFILLICTVPIFFSMSFSTLVAMLTMTDFRLTVMIQRLFGGMDKFGLMAMPFFIFAANVMVRGGMAARILQWVRCVMGRVRGAPALITELSCMFFGALSGSSPATVVAIGNIMYPELIKRKFDRSFSTGLVTASGSVAILIPPSITLIVYGTTTGASIGALFMAGIGAGVVYGLAMLAYCYYYAVKNNLPVSEPSSLSDIYKSTKEAIWALGVPIIILGGIYCGVFTPAEAAGVSVVYAIFVSTFIYRELDLKDLYEVSIKSAATSANVMLLCAGAEFFGWLFTVAQVPVKLAEILLFPGMTQTLFLILVNIVFLIAGMFMAGASAIIILVPLVYPIAMKLGINPIHLGTVLTANLAIGMFTPPFGLNLFVASGVTKLPISKIVSGVIPFIIISLIALLIITYIPAVSLFIPRLVYPHV